MAELERFGEEGFGGEVLFFEVGVEEHGDVADEDTAEPSRANFGRVEDNEAVFAEGLEVAEFGGEIAVEVDVKFAGDFLFQDDGVAEEAADDRAAKAVVVGEMIAAHGGDAALGDGFLHEGMSR